MRLQWFLAALLGAALAFTGAGSAGSGLYLQPGQISSPRERRLAAASPGGLGTVGGQVLDPKDKPVAGAHITLQDTEGRHLQTTETNTEGHFLIPSLPEGQYSVRASDQGRVSEWVKNVWVGPGRETDVTLHLAPKKLPSR